MTEAAHLPHNIEAEQALLGALLLNNEVLDRVGDILRPEHFYDPVHSRIYECAIKRIERKALASPVTLRAFLDDDPGLKELGGAVYLVRLAEACISIASCRDYAEVIIEHWRRRMIILISNEIEAAAFAPEADAGALDIVADAEGKFQALGEVSSDRPVRVDLSAALSSALTSAFGSFQARESGDENAIPLIPTGWGQLDALIGGFRPGEFVVIGGATSMGKSVVGTELARSVAKRKVGVVLWGGEMTPEDLSMRLASADHQERTGKCIPYGLAVDGRFGEEQGRALLESCLETDKLPITMIEPSIGHVDRVCGEITRGVRRWRAEGRKVLVVVDYLQLLRAEGRSGYERVSGVSTALKALTIRLRVPVVALAQLSRSREIWPNNRPGLADLRESGQIEQDANTVIFVYRDDYYLERMLQAAQQSTAFDVDEIDRLQRQLDRARGKLDLIVAKQRSGPLGTATVRVDLRTSRVWAPAEDARQPHQQEAF